MKWSIWVTAALLVGLSACRRPNQVGDHVLVEWRGGEYPAVIVGVEGVSRFRVHYDGFSEDWDETVPATRIRGRLSTNPGAVAPVPANKARARASASAAAAPLPPAFTALAIAFASSGTDRCTPRPSSPSSATTVIACTTRATATNGTKTFP